MEATSWLFPFVALELFSGQLRTNRAVATWRAGLESDTAG